MPIRYRVYTNGGQGGPVDYTTPLADTDLLTYTTAALAAPGDYQFAVRAYDDASGLEEPNRDAAVRLVLDAAGADLTARPNAPVGLTALPTAAGSLRLTWDYHPFGQGAAPTAFDVWAGPVIDYAEPPTATLDLLDPASGFLPTDRRFVLDLLGLTSGVAHQIAVRARNAAGTEPNTLTITATPDADPPAVVDLMTASASF